MKYIFTSLSLCVCLLLVGAGCNPAERAAERAIERSAEQNAGRDVNVDLDTNDNRMTVTDEETGGSVTAGESVEFPNDFPSDIPRYPNGTPKMVSSNLGGNQAGYLIQTTDTKDDILNWFRDETSAWSQVSSLDVQGMAMLSFERSEGGSTYSLTISVMEDDSDSGMQNVNVVRAER